MDIRYVIADVFTKQPFGGNQLAVLPDARGLSDGLMQAIAREFNFSETTFVLPPEDPANTRRVRIFTPADELPFAGHPNVGTAAALAAGGDLGATDRPLKVAFEEGAGLVRLYIDARGDGAPWAELTAPQAPAVGAETDADAVAAALGLATEDVLVDRHPPRLASAGVPFVVAELGNCAALARARPTAAALEALPGVGEARGSVFVYTRETGDGAADVRARMFAPSLGIPEDPATGAASAALAGLLGPLAGTPEGEVGITIAQGVEMGRPSLIQVTAELRDGAVATVRVGGRTVIVGEGRLALPDDLDL